MADEQDKAAEGKRTVQSSTPRDEESGSFRNRRIRPKVVTRAPADKMIGGDRYKTK